VCGVCIKVLQDQLQSRVEGKKVNLWTRVVEQLNGPYWRLRGFAVIEVVDGPKGMWHTNEEFRLPFMRKTLERSEAQTMGDLSN
jgi:hypothetical protein